MSDKEIMPKIDIIPGLDKLRAFMHIVFDQCRHEGLSDHDFNRGGAAMIDRELYDRLMTENIAGAGDGTEL